VCIELLLLVCVFDEQLKSQHDAEFPPTDIDEGFYERPTVRGLIHTEEKLHRTLGVPYVHVQATAGSQVETLSVPYVHIHRQFISLHTSGRNTQTTQLRSADQDIAPGRSTQSLNVTLNCCETFHR